MEHMQKKQHVGDEERESGDVGWWVWYGCDGREGKRGSGNGEYGSLTTSVTYILVTGFGQW